jgi:cytochrome c-type biogenesis protein
VSIADSFVAAIFDGPLLVAAPIAAAAGLVSFLSPCVLPLVPGYLSYMTGLSGAALEEVSAPKAVAVTARAMSGGSTALSPSLSTDQAGQHRQVGSAPVAKARVVLAASLFVAGFTAVFATAGALFGNIGAQLLAYQDVVDRVLGAVTILMGLAFMGLLPGMQREFRMRRLPAAGLAGAPLLGIVFGVGWTPCLGPTLAAVQTLAYTQASAGRGALLSVAYCVGLGLPFILTAVAYRRAMATFAVLRRYSRVITLFGGGLLVAVGVALVTGAWGELMIELRGWISGYTAPV